MYIIHPRPSAPADRPVSPFGPIHLPFHEPADLYSSPLFSFSLSHIERVFPPRFLAHPRPPVPSLCPRILPFLPLKVSPRPPPRSVSLQIAPSLARFDPHESPHSREHFHPTVDGGGRRRREESESGRGEPRTGASMAEARGQGERASSPTLTSNKGGELMREGARADTCGYRPTPAIKPSTADPRKTLELNPPRRFLRVCARRVGEAEKRVKKFFSARPRRADGISAKRT